MNELTNLEYKFIQHCIDSGVFGKETQEDIFGSNGTKQEFIPIKALEALRSFCKNNGATSTVWDNIMMEFFINY